MLWQNYAKFIIFAILTLTPMKKYIFLDFDGVLNTERNHSALLSAGKMPSDVYGPLFDMEAVYNLKTIVDATGSGIIITSSWKLEGEDRMELLWKIRQMPGELLGITPESVLSDEDILNMDLKNPETFIGLAGGRGGEIKAWLRQNAPRSAGNYRYVILDDLPDFLREQQENFVQINPRVGITAEDAARAIEILSKP